MRQVRVPHLCFYVCVRKTVPREGVNTQWLTVSVRIDNVSVRDLSWLSDWQCSVRDLSWLSDWQCYCEGFELTWTLFFLFLWCRTRNLFCSVCFFVLLKDSRDSETDVTLPTYLSMEMGDLQYLLQYAFHCTLKIQWHQWAKTKVGGYGSEYDLELYLW